MALPEVLSPTKLYTTPAGLHNADVILSTNFRTINSLFNYLKIQTDILAITTYSAYQILDSERNPASWPNFGISIALTAANNVGQLVSVAFLGLITAQNLPAGLSAGQLLYLHPGGTFATYAPTGVCTHILGIVVTDSMILFNPTFSWIPP